MHRGPRPHKIAHKFNDCRKLPEQKARKTNHGMDSRQKNA